MIVRNREMFHKAFRGFPAREENMNGTSTMRQGQKSKLEIARHTVGVVEVGSVRPWAARVASLTWHRIMRIELDV